MQKSISSSKSALLLLSMLGVLIVSTLVAISSYFLLPSIELDLKTKLVANLSQTGITSSNISVSGRNITLYGSVSSNTDIIVAEDIAKSIWGVRRVNNSLLIKTEEIE